MKNIRIVSLFFRHFARPASRKTKLQKNLSALSALGTQAGFLEIRT